MQMSGGLLTADLVQLVDSPISGQPPKIKDCFLFFLI